MSPRAAIGREQRSCSRDFCEMLTKTHVHNHNHTQQFNLGVWSVRQTQHSTYSLRIRDGKANRHLKAYVAHRDLVRSIVKDQVSGIDQSKPRECPLCWVLSCPWLCTADSRHLGECSVPRPQGPLEGLQVCENLCVVRHMVAHIWQSQWCQDSWRRVEEPSELDSTAIGSEHIPTYTC